MRLLPTMALTVVYIDKGNNTEETGYMLGEWGDKTGKDNYINNYISTTRPKIYVYETDKGKGVVKIKGFTLNHHNAEKLNFASMKKVLECKVKKILVNWS